MNARHLFCATLLLAALLSPSSAQMILAWDSFGLVYHETPTVSPAYPAPFPLPFPPPFPSLGAAVPTPPPLGACAIDNTTGIVYASDGFLIEPSPYPWYPVVAPPPPVFPWPGPMGVGPIHGMDLDPLAGILWVTDGFVAIGVAPVPGTPVIVPAFPVVGPVPVAMPPLTGLDWDPFTGSLWAVDAGGFVYNFLPGGGFIPPMLPPLPGPAPATGIALDKTAPGAGIYVSFAAPPIFEYLSGIALPPGAAPMPNGLSFHDYPAPLLGASSAIAGGPLPALTPLGAAWSGSPFFGLSITGFLPGSPVLLLVDVFPGALLPGGTGFAGGTLYMDILFSPTFGVLPFGPMPPGGLTIPVPLLGAGGVPVPPGFAVYLQAIALESATSPYFSLTDGMQLIVSAP
jgi:hypothetical protein